MLLNSTEPLALQIWKSLGAALTSGSSPSSLAGNDDGVTYPPSSSQNSLEVESEASSTIATKARPERESVLILLAVSMPLSFSYLLASGPLKI